MCGFPYINIFNKINKYTLLRLRVLDSLTDFMRKVFVYHRHHRLCDVALRRVINGEFPHVPSTVATLTMLVDRTETRSDCNPALCLNVDDKHGLLVCQDDDHGEDSGQKRGEARLDRTLAAKLELEPEQGAQVSEVLSHDCDMWQC